MLLVSGVLSARLLGVEDRGHLALFGLFPVILVHIGTLGLPAAATYYIASDKSRARPIVQALRPWALAQFVCLWALHVGILTVVAGGSDRHVLLAACISTLSLPAILAQQYGLAVLQGQGHFRAFNAFRLLPAALFAAGVLLAAVLREDSLWLLTSLWVLSFAVPATLTIRSVSRALPTSDEAAAPPVPEMLRFGIKGLLGSASPLETFRIDQVVVGLFLSPAALGLYVVGVAFTNLPRFVAQSVGMVAYPTVAQRDVTTRHATMWRFFWLAAALAFSIVLAVELALDWLVPALFGPDFADAVPLARILLASGLFLSVRRVLSDGARGAGQPEAGSIAELTAWVSLVPLLIILTPGFGVTGVAWALTISAGVSLASLIIILLVTGPTSRPSAETREPGTAPEPVCPPTLLS